MSEPCYLRFPSVRSGRLTFVADDDVWVCPSSGGTARRLTSDHAPASDTRLSPDGSLVAYTGRRDGAAEVYVAGTDGDPVRRLSYFGDGSTRAIGWSGNNTVLAISASGQPFRSRTWAFELPVTTDGPPARLDYGPVTSVARGPAGITVLGCDQSRSRGAGWKRYRGGTAAKLWIDQDGNGQFQPYLVELAGQLEDPAFYGERIVFLSDHEGTGNVYSALPDGSDLLRHSDHDRFYARALTTDGSEVVYQSAGELWRLSELSRTSTPVRIEIELGSPRSGHARRVLRAAEELGTYAPDETTRASAVELRGSIHWLTHRDGPARWLGAGGGVRARGPRVVGRGDEQRVIFVTDADGEDAVEIVPSTGGADRRRIGSGELGRVLDLAGAPDGRHAAVSTHDGRVVLVGLSDGSVRTIDHSPYGDASGLTFSPDSAWLAWSHAGPEPLRQLKLARVEGGETNELTPLRFRDHHPVFTLDGKYLAFLSERTFDPVYDVHVFDLSFQAGTRPYLITLQVATPSPFAAEPDGRPRRPPEPPGGAGGGGGAAGHAPGAAGTRDGSAAAERATAGGGGVPNAAGDGGAPNAAGGDRADETAAAEREVVVELDGISERVVAFPVAAGRFSRLRATDSGVLWLSNPVLGELGEERARVGSEGKRASLWRFDFAKSRQTELVAELDSFEVSGDGRSIVVRDHDSLVVMPADHKTAPHSPGEDPDPQERLEVDLRRLRLEIDPPVEWTQMYDEAARLIRDHFWIEDFAGVDWPGVVARYRPLLERIATRDDLSDLIWEVQGELGSSHAYEMPPPRPEEAERRLGLLGADLARDEDGSWRVALVLPGETSVLAARSPLAAPGAGVHPGDAILAVDGRPVDTTLGPPAMLAGTAGKPVELTVLPAGSSEPRRIVVEPLADERPLRYQAWVAGRRAATHESSGGRLGYVHIPDMMSVGWAELHRDLRAEVARDGLLIDVRDNGGGHTSQLVLEKLARTVTAWEIVRHMKPPTYPIEAPRGPRVLVTNEYAGSDGDIVTAGFRQRHLGPVIGMRTWGGVIGIDLRYHLVDGSIITQPRYAFWFYDGIGWSVENYGVEPDIEVPFPPQDWGAGRDPQLARGVEVLLALLEDHPPVEPPDPSTRPSRTPPPLPPRPGAPA